MAVAGTWPTPQVRHRDGRDPKDELDEGEEEPGLVELKPHKGDEAIVGADGPSTRESPWGASLAGWRMPTPTDWAIREAPPWGASLAGWRMPTPTTLNDKEDDPTKQHEDAELHDGHEDAESRDAALGDPAPFLRPRSLSLVRACEDSAPRPRRSRARSSWGAC